MVKTEGVFYSSGVNQMMHFLGNYPTDGTVLMPLGNRGNQSAPPFIVINPDASLKGVVVWHVEQVSHNLRK
jgi:hypothetical protein